METSTRPSTEQSKDVEVKIQETQTLVQPALFEEFFGEYAYHNKPEPPSKKLLWYQVNQYQ